MKKVLLLGFALLMLSIVTVIIGGCGSTTERGKEKVKVQTINIDFDYEYFESIDGNFKIHYGAGKIDNIYQGWDFYGFSNQVRSLGGAAYDMSGKFGLLDIGNAEIPFKLKIDVFPANATNKDLSFSAIKIDINNNDIIDGNIDINNYINIGQDGTVSLAPDNHFVFAGELLRVTATAKDGSGATYVFDVAYWVW